MAEVWEGHDEVLSRPVALKLLLPHLASDPNLRERFRREAVTAARLVHPGIVAVFDAGVEPLDGTSPAALGRGPMPEAEWAAGQSTAFIVMELVPGETLRDLVHRYKVLGPRLVVAIAAQVTDALAYAHAQGLVHRDVKPANVLLRDGGNGLAQVKVTDFGIAKAAASPGDLTAHGALLGTPKYVAPEQVQGREPDARTDLYSLGVVMYEMLAGRPPFEGESDMATALAHVQQPVPSLEATRPGLPPGLVHLVSTLMAKEPEQRTPSAVALGRSLAELGAQLGFRASGPGAFLQLGPGAFAGPSGEPGRPVHAGRPGTAIGREIGTGATVRDVGRGPVAETAQATPARRRRPRRLASAVVASLMVVGSLVAAALLYPGQLSYSPRHRGGPTASGGAAGPSASAVGGAHLGILGVKEVVTGGNQPNDNLSELPNLTSANPKTYWQSLIYKYADFGGYGGFGLAVHLDGSHVLHDLVVKTPMRGWSAQVFVASHFANWGGWGKPVSAQDGINGDHTFPLLGKRGDWVLLWMLNPGPSDQAKVDKLAVT